MKKLVPRLKSSHKGQNGRVLIVGGSEDYAGAPAFVGMTALAVLRSGADLVTVAAPQKVAWAINCIAPDLITRKIKCKNFSQKDVSNVIKLARDVDVVVIGNGITITPASKKFMQQVIRKLHGKKMVIDAAALRVIRLQDVSHAVLLPHHGELADLLKHSGINEKNIQKKLKTNVLVKKGHPRTEIMTSRQVAINTTGNAGMTHGGTGDVLAGIVAALIAQGNDLFTSARIAAYVNGAAADILYKKMGFGYLASDLVNAIPFVLKKLQKYEKRKNY